MPNKKKKRKNKELSKQEKQKKVVEGHEGSTNNENTATTSTISNHSVNSDIASVLGLPPGIFFQSHGERHWTCNHGSTTEAFTVGTEKSNRYSEVLRKFLDGRNNIHVTPKSVMGDEEFATYAIALSVDIYLQSKDAGENDLLYQVAKDVFEVAMFVKYGDANPAMYRDKMISMNESKKGFILCLSRSVPCDCMSSEKERAKQEMKRFMRCFNCNRTNVPIKENKYCGGCKAVTYCSRSCQKKHWLEHKATCQFMTAWHCHMDNGNANDENMEIVD